MSILQRVGTGMVSSSSARLRRVLRTHLHPDLGAPFWLDRQRTLGLDILREVSSWDDLSLLGEMTPADLSERPLQDFVPRRLQEDLSGYVLGQTGGTTSGGGGGAWTIYRADEFQNAFITPFAVAAEHVGFPRGEQWLYVGPSGPHIIGKVVRRLAACTGSHDPFSVDFDARWAKRLPDGSFALDRYLAHIVEQSAAILHAQEIGVIFTTPAVLGALCEVMTHAQRARVRAVHYGGMEVTPDALAHFQRTALPGAVHLSGYGNTLFGCCLELDTRPGRTPGYFPHGDRLILETVDHDGMPAPEGQPGTVVFSRLDESCMILRMRERDAAVSVAPPPGAPAGFSNRGVLGPHSPRALAPTQAKGLY